MQKIKLVANSITSNEIDISGVHSEEIASKAVINRTIGDAAVTLDKLDNDIHRKLIISLSQQHMLNLWEIM